ncbi:MAG: DUF1573 domain-containing protein [Pirellulaceae bacterium]|jgi:hypothetical protein|nr:DUF1573 domain-containing protein [Pirellulaceae bacterium]
MIRALIQVAGLGWLLCGAAEVTAQHYSSPRFAQTYHDFGTVARGAATEHLFWFTNTCGSDVHVRGVRTSCGCTTPSVVHSTVRHGEQGAIRAIFNTRSFTGQRSANITVVFDRPRYTEVQLHVRGYIRRDVVFEPSCVDFGTIREGEAAQRVIGIDYAGRSDWQITAARVPDQHLSVETRETKRSSGRVGYELIVRLAAGAPAGTIDTELTLETNDSRGNRVPLAVTGQIVPPLSVSPALLYLGNAQGGQELKSRLVVRAAEPFRITAVECEDPRFRFEIGQEAKTLHFIPVTFTAGGETGNLSTKIHIWTDLFGGKTAEVTASATIRP